MARVLWVFGFWYSPQSFCFNTALQINCLNPCLANDLCSLVTAVTERASLSGELARFALNIRSSRRHLFRQLSSDGPSGRALVAARSAALILWGGWARGRCSVFCLFLCSFFPVALFRSIFSNSPSCCSEKRRKNEKISSKDEKTYLTQKLQLEGWLFGSEDVF